MLCQHQLLGDAFPRALHHYFVRNAVHSGRITLLRICSAFEIQPEQLVEGLFRRRRKE
jgi:hypothetical protein